MGHGRLDRVGEPSRKGRWRVGGGSVEGQWGSGASSSPAPSGELVRSLYGACTEHVPPSLFARFEARI